MEFFKQNTRINFMGQRFKCAILSAVLFILAIVAISMYGLNLGLDFTGGTQVQVHDDHLRDTNQVRTALTQAGLPDAAVQYYGSTTDVLITLHQVSHPGEQENERLLQEKTKTLIQQALPTAQIQQISYIGPTVGQELASKGVLAIIVALIATMIYIALRFEYRFAVSSTLALIHDPVLILGVFAYWQIPFDLVTLAAVLTVIGYSLNDTIVVFDRVRENFRRLRAGTPVEIMNISINQTLSRTIMTSTLTLLAVLSLLLFGGPVLHGFALAFLIGIVVGTYSSIYIAGALAIVLGLKREDLLPAAKKYVDDRP